jgi:predicted phage terminase large subunit-like protein
VVEGLDPELAWKLFPHTLAERASGGTWTAHRWLKYLSLIVTSAIINGNGRILLSAPPQHGKSEFLSNWTPTWFLHNFQELKVILGTYGQDYGNKWGTKVRHNLVSNPIAAVPMQMGSLSKKKFITKKGGQMMVAGVEGGGTGEGADLFLVDDPYKNPSEANSPEHRQKVMDWFLAVANTRLQANGSIIVMHTRWNDDDLIGALAKLPGWTYINLEAICEHPEKDPLGRVMGEALCPQRFNEADLAQKRIDVTDLFWFPMYQGNPLDVKGAIIKETNLRYYDENPMEIAKSMDELGVFADLTFEKKEENDFSVFELWGRRGANIYCLYQIREKMGINEQLTAFKQIISANPKAYHKEIEKKANGAAIIDLCSAEIPGIVANNPMTSKGARLAAVSPLYISGNVWYPNPLLPGNEWAKENVYEIVRMTLSGSKAKHDDTVDVATMAVSHFGRMSSALAKMKAMTAR